MLYVWILLCVLVVLVDFGMIECVLINLFDNVLWYMFVYGEVEIVLVLYGDCVVVIVLDIGVGILVVWCEGLF